MTATVAAPRKLSSSDYQVLGAWAALQIGDRNTVEGSALHLRGQSQGKTSWALYSVGGLTGDRPVRLSVDAARVGAVGAYWLGVADYTTYTWQWSGPLTGASTQLLNSDTLRDRYVDRDGTLYYAVVLTAGEVLVHSGTATTSPNYFTNNPHYPLIKESSLTGGKSTSWLTCHDQYVGITWEHVKAFSPWDTKNQAVSYEVFRQGTGDASPVLIGSMSTPLMDYPEPLSYEDPPLNTYGVAETAPGREYSYFVRAVNASGGCTPLAFAGTVTIPNYWVTSWGTSQSAMYADSADSDGKGNVYTTASGYSNGTQGYDLVLLKYDANGSLVWQRAWGTEYADGWWYGRSVAGDGSLWLSAMTQRDSSSAETATLLGFSPDGNLICQWTRGWGADKALYPVRADDKAVYCAGVSQATATTHEQPFVFALDTNGALLWQRVVTGSTYVDLCDILPLAQGVVLVAQFRDYSYRFLTVLVLLDHSGHPVWQRKVGLPLQFDYGEVTALASTPSSVVCALGAVDASTGSGPAYAFKVDLQGNLLWQKQWTSTERVVFSHAQQASGAPLVLAGVTMPSGSESYYPPLILECDASGSLVLVRSWPDLQAVGWPDPVPLGDSLVFQLKDNTLARWGPGGEIMRLATWHLDNYGSSGDTWFSLMDLSQGRLILAGNTENHQLDNGRWSWTNSAAVSEPAAGEWVAGDLTWEVAEGLIADDLRPLSEANGTVSDPDRSDYLGYGGCLTMAWDPALIWKD